MSILEAISFHLPFLFSVKSEVNWTTREKKRNVFYFFTVLLQHLKNNLLYKFQDSFIKNMSWFNLAGS